MITRKIMIIYIILFRLCTYVHSGQTAGDVCEEDCR